MTKITDSIKYLKGVGEKRALSFNKLGVDTIYSLLLFYPRAYMDFSDVKDICECDIGEICCFKAKVFKKQGEQRIRKGLSVFKVFVTDSTQDVTITIFNSKYVFDSLEIGKEYTFYGKMQGKPLKKEMNSPSFVDLEKECEIKAIYNLTHGLSNKMVQNAVKQALLVMGDSLEDNLPDYIKKQENLCHARYAIENIHFPQDMNALKISKKRLVFEELLALQLGLLNLKKSNRDKTSVKIKDVLYDEFLEKLPFKLTDDQLKAINDATNDFKKDRYMNRLIQGDVGSGKTMIACALSFIMHKNGYQTAVMAPTEILAIQHYNTFKNILEGMGVKCELLVGSLTLKQKKQVKEKIASGEASVIIGTHALIQDNVLFSNLGLVVTDEQHRFGVNQRAKLAQKGENAHRLVMSATPIPRTLALIIYGDLDVSVIKTVPLGRMPIQTYMIDSKKRLRAFNFIKKHIDEGYQAYIVCPLIEENEESEQNLFSVEEYAQKLKQTVLGQYNIGVLHGKMKPSEKEKIMLSFKNKEIDLLISTTVVEVGVDVPNAVIMMIENAERFGLSQLHQLRGRVGRGNIQSYCILVSDNKSDITVNRLKIMTKSSDGFYISEQDLKQRGPGDFFGERQHGLPTLKIANMVDDMSVLLKTQKLAKQIIKEDPFLQNYENRGLKKLVDDLFENKSE